MFVGMGLWNLVFKWTQVDSKCSILWYKNCVVRHDHQVVLLMLMIFYGCQCSRTTRWRTFSVWCPITQSRDLHSNKSQILKRLTYGPTRDTQLRWMVRQYKNNFINCHSESLTLSASIFKVAAPAMLICTANTFIFNTWSFSTSLYSAFMWSIIK